MLFVTELLHNHLLLSALCGWAAAQVLKTIIFAVSNRGVDWSRLMGDGGMPSGHSATVCALAASAGLEYGVSSAYFGITTVLGIIVMHDAMGVRLEAGKHAQALNELRELLDSDREPEEKLKELLGHTPLQVFAGGTLGIAVAFLLQ
ncbi:MAG: divergent PAP2 family protein [Clostridiales bacterium]|nr:divergent PAP2 family protein [Candidatus Cacconaster stercorequi]